VVSPSELMTEVAGPKMEDDSIGDPETAQAFAFNFLSLWNEELARRPAGPETDAWRAELQERVNAEAKEAQKPYIAEKKPGRNEPCHCGSGKKYKRCHGAG
jgi:preprotein translocase subunit SecA